MVPLWSRPLEQLAQVNAGLKARKLRMTVEAKRDRLWIRGTFPSPQTGLPTRQRLPLDLPAEPGSLLSAEGRALQFAEMLASGRWPAEPLPWAKAVPVVPAVVPPPEERPEVQERPAPTCEEAISLLQREFWDGRIRTSAAERTWDRLAVELKRLPPKATLTADLLEAVARTATQPGSRSRLEFVKVGRRLAAVVGIDAAGLAKLAGTYQPAERTLPTDEQLESLLEALRGTTWFWVTAAAATYGVRPAEIPSLQLHDDGTASTISIKTKGAAPTRRLCFALPRTWVDRFNLAEVSIPGGVRWTEPAQYDSATARRWVDSWRHGWRTTAAQAALRNVPEGFSAYDLRHAWAVRSIASRLPMTLCAKALGHSVAVHERTYHRWLNADALRGALAELAGP